VDARFPLCDAVRTQQELWIAGPGDISERYPDILPSEGSQAWAALPLQIEGVTLGAVGWSFQRQCLASHQRACLRSLAEAGGVALHRAEAFDSERAARLHAEASNRESLLQNRILDAMTSTLDATANRSDIPKTLEQIARVTLPRLGEWCSIQLLDDHGRLRQAAAIHRDAAKERLLTRVVRDWARSTRKLPDSLRNGDHPVLIQSTDPESVHAGGLTPRESQVLRVVGLERVLIVALRIHDRTLGTIAFGTGNPALVYSAVDISFADRVARSCAAWLEYIHLREIAERAEQAREDFVAATSHELRTPLSHIKGFVSTLRTEDTAWDTTTRDDFLAEIEHEADRLASLVDSLLDLSRIDSGGLDPTQRRAIAPAALVAAGIDRVRQTLGDRPLEVQVSQDVPTVWADASQVERVIANLLDNAAKYSPPQQPIALAARSSGRAVMFRVEDRGLGIPSAHMERIFEPFFREPNGSYPSKPGTGLGLAICRSIIRSQRGRIWAEQRPGGGAVIAFTLPTATGTKRT
jgi:K+-sensing histidine kinase KdpD